MPSRLSISSTSEWACAQSPLASHHNAASGMDNSVGGACSSATEALNCLRFIFQSSLVPHSNKFHSAIFGATFRRGIAGDRPSVSITFGAQPAAVYSMIREPVDHRLGAFTRQFQVSFFR